jgi:hypothetical protein
MSWCLCENVSLMPSPYLSKSDFKAAFDCSAKLRFRKAGYPSNHSQNEYMRFLADGGFMVEHLAKAKYPVHTDLVDITNPGAAFARTKQLLAESHSAVIFEAAALYGKFLARIDILCREGNSLHLIEVKSSSVRSETRTQEEVDEDEELEESKEESMVRTDGKKKGEPKRKWMPYLIDVTFQRMALQLAFPEFKHVRASLCLVDKSALARECETLDYFVLTRSDDGQSRSRPTVEYTGNAEDLLTSELLVIRDVTEITHRLMDRVKERARELSALIRPDGQAAAVAVSLPETYKFCKNCEYRLKGDTARTANLESKHGFQECWGARATTPFHILDLTHITGLANGTSDPVKALLEHGGSSYLELDPDELGKKKDGTRYKRRLLQWENSRGGGTEHLTPTLVEELRGHLQQPGAPFHFLDFEACNVALPHHAGMHPYDRVVFQFSCHTLHGSEDESAPLPAGCHRGWINTEREFPNFKFARALRECLGEAGTVYVWSSFEQSTLEVVLRQLRESLQCDASESAWATGVASLSEVRELAEWLERLLGPETLVRKGNKLVSKRISSPRLRDLHALCRRDYFHPDMLGRTSIKVVLPAIWRHQPDIHRHPWFAEYYRVGADGIPLDPYKSLSPLPLGAEGAQQKVVSDGTDAIRIYEELIFRKSVPEEQVDNCRKLLEQYCKLDTAAMIMIWKHWSRALAPR